MSDLDPLDQQDQALDAFAAFLQQRNQEMERVVEAINADFHAALRLTFDACPVQIEGEIDGLALYFRARWSSWRLAIATDLEQAIKAARQADAVFYHASSAGLSDFEASWLEPAQVDLAVRACLNAFRTGQTNAGYVELPPVE
jgi:hypothetical protein